MYNVMLVDDDVPVLEFLRHSIRWNELGLSFSGSFENGKKAYEHVTEGGAPAPDILVTDIGMPQMNGLELISRLKEINPAIAVIILSCHDEFSYAQQAIKLGVDDYVLKETIEPDTIGTMLETVIRRLEKRKAEEGDERQPGIRKDEQLSFVKERFIREILYYPIADLESWRSFAAEIGIRLGERSYTPVLLVIDRYTEARARFVSDDNLTFAVENIVDELLIDSGREAVSFRVAHKELMLLVGDAVPDPLRAVQPQNVETILRKIRQALLGYLNLSATSLIGRSQKDPSQLRIEMQSLVKLSADRFYIPEGSIGELEEKPFSKEDLFAHYAQASEQFRQVVLHQEEGRIDAVVKEWTDRIRTVRYEPDAVKEWFLKLLLDLHMKFKTMEHVPSSYSRESLHQTFLDADRLDRLASIAGDFMREAISRMSVIYGQPRRTEIAEAQRYIELNVHRKITLEEVADHLHLNPSYFSRLFKKETGQTFVDFVTRTKMEKAKEQLDTSRLSVHEIADRLGYDNKSYFIKLFKAFSGMTPGEYAGKARE